jgi:hypothetical protein
MSKEALANEAKILQGDGCEIVLNGITFSVPAKTPRQTRRLMGPLATMIPQVQKLAAIDLKNPTPEALAIMFAAFEPMCDFIARCCDDPAVDAALEEATEAEIVAAFRAVEEVLTVPFVLRLKRQQNGLKQSGATPH